MPPRKRLGQILIELGLIDEHQLQSALGHQKQWGGKIGAVLVQKGFCTEANVVTALSQHLGMPIVRLAEVAIDPRAQKVVSRQVAEKLHVFAYELTGSGRSEVVTIAMSDPTDLSAVDQVAFHTGKRIKPMLCGDTELVTAIQQHYPPEAAAPAASGARPGARPLPPLGPPPVMQPQKGPGAEAAAAQPASPAGAGPPKSPPSSESAPMADLETLAATAASESAIEGIEAFQGGGSPADVVQGVEPISDSTRQGGAADRGPSEGIAGYDAGSADGAMEGLEPIAAHAGPEGTALAPSAAPGEAAQEALDPPAAPREAFDDTWADAPLAATDTTETWVDVSVEDGAADELPADAILGVADESAEHGAPADGAGASASSWDDAPEDAPAAAPAAWDDAPAPAAAESSPESAAAPAAWDDVPAAVESAPESAAAPAAWDDVPAGVEASPESSAAPGAWDDAPAAVESSPESSAAPGAWDDAPAAVESSPESSAAPGAWDDAPAAVEPSPESSAAPGAWDDAPAAVESAPESAAAPGAWDDAPAAVESAPESAAAPGAWDDVPAAVESAPKSSAAPGGWDDVPAAVESAPESSAAPPAWDEAGAAEPPPANDQFDTQPVILAGPSPWDPPVAQADAEGTEAPHAADVNESAEQSGTYGRNGTGSPVQEAAAPDGWSEPSDALAAGADASGESQAETPAPPAWGEEGGADVAPDDAPESPAAAGWIASSAAPDPAAGGEEPAESTPYAMPGWTAPPPDPDPEGAGWLGEALAETAPLSHAEVDTLRSAGIEPSDGAGALRLLAGLLRTLERRGILDVSELASDVRAARVLSVDESTPQSDEGAASQPADADQPV
jgi:Type II secretion system (T2SS), protein E, N-terminal domain